MIRHAMFATLALATAGGIAAQMHRGADTPAIAAALADPARADQAVDDDRRKAAQVIAFAGVKPGDTVVDYLPGRYYWTRILTDIVGPQGKVLAMWPTVLADRSGKALPDTLLKWKLANVSYVANPTNLPSAAAPVDVFWTVENYHDIPRGGAGEPALRAFDGAVFRMLKPGGTYIVVDHADAPGTALAGTQDKHRIDPDFVKRQVQSVGFRFVAASTVLHNPSDDHSKSVFDPAIRGHTDQFVYKFRKP